MTALPPRAKSSRCRPALAHPIAEGTFPATRAERAQRGQRTCMPSQTEIRFAHKASEVPHEPKLLSTFANYLCLSGAFCVRPTGKNRDPGGHARRPGITGHLKRRGRQEESDTVRR